MHTRHSSIFVLASVLLASACGPESGGQSGTDSDGTPICLFDTVAIPVDQPVAALGASPNDFYTRLEGAYVLESDSCLGPGISLELTRGSTASSRTEKRGRCQTRYDLDVAVHVDTSVGAIDQSDAMLELMSNGSVGIQGTIVAGTGEKATIELAFGVGAGTGAPHIDVDLSHMTDSLHEKSDGAYRTDTYCNGGAGGSNGNGGSSAGGAGGRGAGGGAGAP